MSDCLREMQFNIDIWYATIHTIRLQFQRESSTSVCNDIILMWITRPLINNYNGRNRQYHVDIYHYLHENSTEY